MTTATAPAIDRRQFDRFALQPMYTRVVVQRVAGGRMEEYEGYAYDISEGGMRIELDERLERGERVNVTLELPGGCEPLPIRSACRVAWVNDEMDDPAMPRMALRVIKYFDQESRGRLIRLLGSGCVHRVA